MEVICVICKKRISDWQDATGKTEKVGSDTVHKSCLEYWWDKQRMIIGPGDQEV